MAASVKHNTKKVRNFVNIFREQVVELSKKHMKKLAEQSASQLRRRLRSQLFRHRPLSPAYLERKKRERLDTRILIATKEYLNSIDVHERTRKGEIVSYSVGFAPNKVHEASGLRFSVLARIHEFGSKKARIPARPHWRPVWSIVKRKNSRLFAQKVMREAVKKAKK